MLRSQKSMLFHNNFYFLKFTTFLPFAGKFLYFYQFIDKFKTRLKLNPSPEPETDTAPDYVNEIYLDKIIVVDVTSLKFVRALGKHSLLRNADWTVIHKDQIEEKDSICSRGIFYKVKTVGDNFNTPLTHNIVRLTTNVTGNVNNQPFQIAKIPKLQRCICEILLEFVSINNPVSIVLEKIDSKNIGSVNIKFQNACFNALGFMIYDTAICLDTQ